MTNDRILGLLDQLEDSIDHLLQEFEESASDTILPQLKVLEDALAKLRGNKTPVPAEMLRLHTDLKLKATESIAATDRLTTIYERLAKLADKSRPGPSHKKRQSNGRAGGIRVPQLKEVILDAIHHLGGSASRAAVFTRMEERLQYEFDADDLEIVAGGRPRWQQRAAQARRELVRDGLMEDCKGVWAVANA